jgi:alpha-galactosidase
VRDLLLFPAEDFEHENRKYYNDLSYDINEAPLIDLSRPEGRDYLLATMERMVDAHGAGWIWYDFNTDPRPFFFNAHEEPERRGLLELHYYQGMDDVMSEFVRRHPDVWVEMCASGGRMINLGVMRYSHSFWITDYTGADPDIAGDIRSGANLMMPAVYVHQSLYMPQECMESDQPIPAHCALAHFGGLYGFSQNVLNWPEPSRDVLTRMADVYKNVRHLLAGDYYRLLPQAESRDAWEAWQFHRPDTGEGLVVVLRLSGSMQEQGCLDLRGMAAGASAYLTKCFGDAKATAEGTSVNIAFRKDRSVVLTYSSA